MSSHESGYLSPTEITEKSFETKRRGGFDPDAVKRHLASVAETVQALTVERQALLEKVEALNEQLATGDDMPTPDPELDEDALAERLGKHAARVLAEARSAAADRIAEAEAQADDIRAAAEEVFAERSVLADQEAMRIRESADELVADRQTEAEQAAAQIIARAEADADVTRSSVSGEQQAADAEAARIVREAELTRRQILEDLARRRSSARRQIEQLRAGRERLLASHETVRRALDDISEELTISMSEARAAAETAGHSVSETTIEELEAEIETARLTGLLDTGPVPVVSRPARPASKSAIYDATQEHDDAPEPPSEELGESKAKAKPESKAEPESEITTTETNVDADEPAVTETRSTAGLADVVQLDRARNDVDTATHPATGRDASSARSNGGDEATSDVSTSTTSTDAKEPARLEAVPSVGSDPEPEATQAAAEVSVTDLEAELDDSVGDLFATLRSTKEPAKTAATKKSAKAKNAAVKKKAPKKSTSATSAPSPKTPASEPDVDSSGLARRLKRILADEQSGAMSAIKSAAELPRLDALLGEEHAHCEIYWTEVIAQVDGVASSDTAARSSVEALVSAIRHRVGGALDEAGDDSEVAVASLRNVYREIKTQRVGACADEVCRMAAGRSSDRA